MHRFIALTLLTLLTSIAVALRMGSEVLGLLFLCLAVFASFVAIGIGGYSLVNIAITAISERQKFILCLRLHWLSFVNAIASTAFLWWLTKAATVMANL